MRADKHLIYFYLKFTFLQSNPDVMLKNVALVKDKLLE